MKYCPRCGDLTMISEKKFCHNDGTQLLECEICQCGKEIMPFEKFCPYCGKQAKK